MIVQEWVDQIRESLTPGVIEQVNKLSAAYTPGDTTLTMQYPLAGAFAKGVPLCVGLNTMMVWSANDATHEVEVEAGWAGSTPTSAAAQALVRIRPAMFTHRIFGAVNDVLNELSSPLKGIYGVGTVDLDYDPIIDTYDLTDAENFQSIIGVQIGDPDDDTSRWPSLSSTTDWELRSTAATAQAPSGRQLRIHGPMAALGQTLRVTYRTVLSQADSLSDDVSMTGLPDTAYDLPVLGAAARLAFPQEYKRNAMESQPDTRRAGEVPPGARLGAARALQQRYEVRVDQEAARLIAAYPYRSN